MGREKVGALTQKQLEFLGELYLNGDLVFKKVKPIDKTEFVWIFEMMQLIRKHHLPPRQAQISVAETKEFIEWNKKRSKIKKNQDYQHFKDAENLWSKYMRMGGIMSSLKRNKKGSVKGIKKGNTRKKI